MKKYYVEMDCFESSLKETASEDGDYYRVEDVDGFLIQLSVRARTALTAESPIARKQAIQDLLSLIEGG